MSDAPKKYDPWDPKGHLAALNKRMDAADEEIDIDIHFALGSVDFQNVVKIAEAMKAGQPFGLQSQRSYVIFIPAKRIGYWLWSDLTTGPTFAAKNDRQFAKVVKMQFLTHREFMSQEKLLLITEVLYYGRKIKELESIPRGDVSESGDEAGPLEPGAGRVLPGGPDGSKALHESSGRSALQIILPESVCDVKGVPCDGEGDAPGAGG